MKKCLLRAFTVIDEATMVRQWDSIEEVEPDEIDLKMIQEIQNDPDCQTFE